MKSWSSPSKAPPYDPVHLKMFIIKSTNRNVWHFLIQEMQIMWRIEHILSCDAFKDDDNSQSTWTEGRVCGGGVKDGWAFPATSVGTPPSRLDRKITLFRENNTLAAPPCVCARESPAVSPSTKDHFIWLVCISDKHTEQKAPPPRPPRQLMD